MSGLHENRQAGPGGARTVVRIEVRSDLDVVLDEGSSLLRYVTEELGSARVVEVRVDYGDSPRAGRVLDVGPDLVDLVGGGCGDADEAAFWGFARQASRRVEIGPDGLGVHPAAWSRAGWVP